MLISGPVWLLGDDVNTDLIMAGRYANIEEPKDKMQHILEDYDPRFAKEFTPGGIVVAGENFGCGSSREIAAQIFLTVKAQAVVASSFARIFYRNAINIGLPIVEIQGIHRHFKQGDLIALDLNKGSVANKNTGECFLASPFPPFIQEV